MKPLQAKNMLEGYNVPAILVSANYEIQAVNTLYTLKFGDVALSEKPKCYTVSHGYNKPCDQCGEDCPLMAATQSKRAETVLHIHQGLDGPEHIDVQMIPIFNDDGDLDYFVELLKPVPLASGKHSERQVVGASPIFINMLAKVNKVASTQENVLLLGESGTGKELISKLVHLASDRKDKPIVTLECSGLSESLIESELFGHVKGAFTGAYNDRQGLVQEANGGTLFLDEIGDVSLATQVKLLRLIETKTYRKVGDTSVRHSDFRLICATHKNLQALINLGEFRLDLYHRINVYPITVPSLRQRASDIPALALHLLKNIDAKTHTTEAAMQVLVLHTFNGNIRELKNLLTRAHILSDTNIIDAQHITEAIAMDNPDTTVYAPLTHTVKNHSQNSQNSQNSKNNNPLNKNEEVYIKELLTRYQGDKKAVAEQLGISLRTLYRKLKP